MSQNTLKPYVIPGLGVYDTAGYLVFRQGRKTICGPDLGRWYSSRELLVLTLACWNPSTSDDQTCPGPKVQP
jgi:hypothetical protein